MTDWSLIAARHAARRLDPEEAVAAAGTALAKGEDTPTLRELAGEFGGTMREVGPLLERTLHELRVPLPTKRQGLHRLAVETAAKIVSGAVAPLDGAAFIASLLYEFGEDRPFYVDDFWLLADYEFWDQDAPPRAEVEADIVETARRLLGDATESNS